MSGRFFFGHKEVAVVVGRRRAASDGDERQGQALLRVREGVGALARERDVQGPYNIARQVQDVTGYKVSGQAVSKYLYEESVPKRPFIEAFAEAFVLTRQERAQLAWVYAYGSRSDAAFLFQEEDTEGG
jgi:streptomycin 6-kinase